MMSILFHAMLLVATIMSMSEAEGQSHLQTGHVAVQHQAPDVTEAAAAAAATAWQNMLAPPRSTRNP